MVKVTHDQWIFKWCVSLVVSVRVCLCVRACKKVSIDGRIVTNSHAAVTCLFSLLGCGGTFTASSGIISSPSYPFSYPNNQDCRYILTAQTGSRVSITFSRFSTQAGVTGCNTDYIQVRGHLILSLCAGLRSDVCFSVCLCVWRGKFTCYDKINWNILNTVQNVRPSRVQPLPIPTLLRLWVNTIFCKSVDSRWAQH